MFTLQVDRGEAMISVADKIMRRVRGYGRGKWVCTPKDFLDFGSRNAVDKALSRLVKSGLLRRISRGLYYFPRTSSILKRPVPPSVDTTIEALARRDGRQFVPDGIVAANSLGLTNAVPAKIAYLTDGATRILKVGGRTVCLKRAGNYLKSWLDRPGATVVLALDWLGQPAASRTKVIHRLRSCLPDEVKQDLFQGIDLLPPWMAGIVSEVTQNISAAA